MTDLTPREVETACHCAGSPHPRDRFVLPAELPVPAGIAAISALSQVGEHGDAAAALIYAILLNGGIESWNLVDEDGAPLKVTPSNVAARVTWQKGGVELSNAAFAQYVNGKDLAPFGLTSSRSKTAVSSPNGQTEPSTLPKTRSSRKRPAPSA
jgi:hypothetical protein